MKKDVTTTQAKPKSAKARTTKATVTKTKAKPKPKKAEWNLRLYVAGQTPKSMTAFANLKKICEQHLPDRYSIEVIDLTKQPQLAQKDQIMALPTLVRKLPEPIKRVIGDLSNVERVMVGMDLEAVK